MGLRAARLRRPEWLIGAGGVVLLVGMLLFPWFTLTQSTPPPGPRYEVARQVDGWNGLNHSHWLLLVTILLALSAVFFQAQRRAPAIPVTLSLFAGLLGGMTVIWLIIRVLIAPPGGRGIGGWIGLLGAIGVAYGGYASIKLEGISAADAPTEIRTVDLAAEAGR